MTAPAIPLDMIQLAHELADISGELIRRYYRQDVDIVSKEDDSPVTVADRDAEQAMRERIRSARPHDGIIGEEFGEDNATAEWVWVLDPIDGTKSFTVGRPLFVTLIGLLHFGIPVLGVINQPVVNDRWIGGVGVPTTLNGEIVQGSTVKNLADARVGTTGPEHLQVGASAFATLVKACRYPVYGGDGYMYGQVAVGWLDIVVEEGLKLHDFAALAPVVVGAGGCMTDWQGAMLRKGSNGRVLAAANADLHAQVLPILGSLPV